MSTDRCFIFGFTAGQTGPWTLVDMQTSPCPLSCPLCARSRTVADIVGLEWSSQHESDGSITWLCPTCTRAQLWRIEAHLAVASPTAPSAPTPDRRAA